MKTFLVVLPLALALTGAESKPAARPQPPPNPAIDMDGYLKVAREAAQVRQDRRVTEDEFLRMSGEKGTIVLDARSKEMYDRLHVDGAINLSFPDIDLVSLEKVLPDKKARILIYCNNNFTSPNAARTATGRETGVVAVALEAMRPKMATASLNISTFISLYSYGYTNVYELAPLIEPAKSRLPLVSTAQTK